jgi:hypothetical protein
VALRLSLDTTFLIDLRAYAIRGPERFLGRLQIFDAPESGNPRRPAGLRAEPAVQRQHFGDGAQVAWVT